MGWVLLAVSEIELVFVRVPSFSVERGARSFLPPATLQQSCSYSLVTTFMMECKAVSRGGPLGQTSPTFPHFVSNPWAPHDLTFVTDSFAATRLVSVRCSTEAYTFGDVEGIGMYI